MQLVFTNPSIVIFDELVKVVESGDWLPLPVSETGWAPRKVLVVNNGTQTIGFSAIF